jgi:hypothetical protein
MQAGILALVLLSAAGGALSDFRQSDNVMMLADGANPIPPKMLADGANPIPPKMLADGANPIPPKMLADGANPIPPKG